jgi:hypothetical protein
MNSFHDPITGDVTRKFKSITYKSAWRMLQQIRIAMANRETEHIFEAFIEVDETYIGGRPRKLNNQQPRPEGRGMLFS